MSAAIPTTFNLFDFSKREMGFLFVATLLHGLLLLWKGIPLELLNQMTDVGEIIVEVEFQTEMPKGLAQIQGDEGAKPKGLLAKMKKLFEGANESGSTLAMGRRENKIQIDHSSPFQKAETTLKNKEFKGLQDFTETNQTKKETLAMGKATRNPEIDSSEEKPIERVASLQEKNYTFAKADAPFKIVKPKNADALAMTNVVPVNVGQKTTDNIKSIPTGNIGGGELKSRSPGGSGGFTASGSAGNRGSTTGLAGLSSGGNSRISGAGPVGESPSKYESGAGQGAGLSERGRGVYDGGTSGGGGFGSRTSGSGNMAGGEAGLVKGTGLGETGTGRGQAGNSPFTIDGPLKNRKILKKSIPSANEDARVALRFRVDWSGRVLDGIVIVASSGNPSFDQKVLNALKEWIFSTLPSERTNEIQEGVITFRFKGV